MEPTQKDPKGQPKPPTGEKSLGGSQTGANINPNAKDMAKKGANIEDKN